MVNVFEVFLPQLLLYPNPSDPLNGEAAALMMRDPTAYEQRVKGTLSFTFFKWMDGALYIFIIWAEYCEKYAKPEDVGGSKEENLSLSDDDDDEMSEDEYDSADEAMVGPVDP